MAVMKLIDSAYENEYGCILATKYLNDKGYPRMRMHKVKRYMSHVMYERYIGEVPEGMCMLHKCDTPACVNPEHLFIGTKADNTYDMVGKERNFIPGKGEKHHRTVVSNDDALKIAKEYVPRKVPASFLAEKYGTTRAVIYSIVHKKTYGDLWD